MLRFPAHQSSEWVIGCYEQLVYVYVSVCFFCSVN